MTVEWETGDSKEAVLIRLVETYQIPLKHICYMILKDESLAEDAAQETFIKAYKALDNFRGDSSEKTWLMRIGMNVCRDLRRSRWFRYVDRSVTPEALPIAAASQQDEDAEDLAQAILRLPDKEKEVILLYYYQNFTVTELAQTLGLAPSSVSNRLKKAREKLRAALERGNDRG